MRGCSFCKKEGHIQRVYKSKLAHSKTHCTATPKISWIFHTSQRRCTDSVFNNYDIIIFTSDPFPNMVYSPLGLVPRKRKANFYSCMTLFFPKPIQLSHKYFQNSPLLHHLMCCVLQQMQAELSWVTHGCRVIYPPSWDSTHISINETLPNVFAVIHWGPVWINLGFFFRQYTSCGCDQQTNYREQQLMCLVANRLLHVSYNIYFRAKHIPCKINVIAELFSRLQVNMHVLTSPA